MRALIYILLFSIVAYGCLRVVSPPDYSSKVSTFEITDNVVDRTTADSVSCIKLNTDYEYSNGDTYSNGTYDTVNGNPVCGVSVSVTTADGHKYGMLVNRFNNDMKAVGDAATKGGVVSCDAAREKCYVGSAGYIFGSTSVIYKRD